MINDGTPAFFLIIVLDHVVDSRDLDVVAKLYRNTNSNFFIPTFIIFFLFLKLLLLEDSYKQLGQF